MKLFSFICTFALCNIIYLTFGCSNQEKILSELEYTESPVTFDVNTLKYKLTENTSLWDSDDFQKSFKLNIQLSEVESQNAKKYAKGFSNHLQNGEYYLHYLVQEIKRKNLPMELAVVPMMESGFNPRAHSPSGAKGLWQFVNVTGKKMGLKVSRNYNDFYDFKKSTESALEYLKFLRSKTQNWNQAIAAYNQGLGSVYNQLKSGGLSNSSMQYVNKFRIYVTLLKNHKQYRIQMPKIQNRSKFVHIAIHDIPSNHRNMQKLAKIGNIDIDILRKLNSGYLSDNLDNHGVLIPSENYSHLINKLNVINKF